jgi:non-ribosomal peptide synthase protein (TIGR01720 family)
VVDLFSSQTIAELSNLLSGRGAFYDVASSEQGRLSGRAGLLPIQSWYFDREPEEISHYNQDILLNIDKRISREALQSAIQQLVGHHDALRFRYNKEDGNWQQHYGDYIPRLKVHDLRSVTDTTSLLSHIQDIGEQTQRSLDIYQGALVSAALMLTPSSETSNRFLLVIHHLAVDGVSWRILLEELDQLLSAYQNGDTGGLARKTSSYRTWYETLKRYGTDAALQDTGAWWYSVHQSYKPLQKDKPEANVGSIADQRTYTAKLPVELTRQLIQEVPRVYQTEINDVLLSALGRVLCRWVGEDSVVLGLEGHGREALSDEVDLSRTVGWFTNLYPVRLSRPVTDNDRNWLISTKESLRQIPAKGIGYGVLKYINEDHSLAGEQPWDIMFNYLGQLDNITAGREWFSPAIEAHGQVSAPGQQALSKMVLNSMVYGGELWISWSYSSLQYEEATIKSLCDDYLLSITQLIRHCLEQEKSIYTPSDYGLGKDISYEELNKFLEDTQDTDENILSF